MIIWASYFCNFRCQWFRTELFSWKKKLTCLRQRKAGTLADNSIGCVSRVREPHHNEDSFPGCPLEWERMEWGSSKGTEAVISIFWYHASWNLRITNQKGIQITLKHRERALICISSASVFYKKTFSHFFFSFSLWWSTFRASMGHGAQTQVCKKYHLFPKVNWILTLIL